MFPKQNDCNPESVKESGFTLIEVLIAISLVAFSLIAILNAFVYKGQVDAKTNDRNMAIILAEEKVEEYFKFPFNQMPAGGTDFIALRQNREPQYFSSRSAAEAAGRTFERTVSIVEEANTALITVTVSYGSINASADFSHRIQIQTRKGM